jgi:putative membrane protein
MKLTTLTLALAACAALAAGRAAAADAKETGKALSDTAFVQKAAEGGMAEVALGKLAAERAENADVKKFAERMVTDHSMANRQLMAVAEKVGAAVPKSLDQKHMAHMEHLSAMKGAAFDKAYMAHMVKDHEEDVALFTAQAAAAQDPGVKEFAAKTLPTLKEHLEMARKVAAKVGATEGREKQ